ncbi:MAG: TonB family protein, partial [Casimicrobiaceae bacterium]
AIAATAPASAPVQTAAAAGIAAVTTGIAAANVADLPEPVAAARQAPRDGVATLPPGARADASEAATGALPAHAFADAPAVAQVTRATPPSTQPLNIAEPRELPLRVSDPQTVRPAAAAFANTPASVPAAGADRALAPVNAVIARPGAPVAAAPIATTPVAAPVAVPVAVPVATPLAAAAHGSSAANRSAASGAASIAAQPPAPERLAMAAPTSAAARSVASVRLLPLTRQDPDFPREAIVRGVSSGAVKARLAIDAAGHVSAVNIVDARPTHVFDRAVTDALSRWTFPAGEPGRSTEVEIAFHRD